MIGMVGFSIFLAQGQGMSAGVASDIILRDRDGDRATITASGELNTASEITASTGTPGGVAHDVLIRDRDGDYAIIQNGKLVAG